MTEAKLAAAVAARLHTEAEIAGIARAAGIPNVHEFSEMEALAEALPGIVAAPGPTFVDLKVVPGASYEYRWDVVHGPESRAVFREAMQAVLAAR